MIFLLYLEIILFLSKIIMMIKGVMQIQQLFFFDESGNLLDIPYFYNILKMQAIKAFISRNFFYFSYVLGILGIATSGLYFEQAYLIDEEWDSYYTYTVSNFLLYIMCFIAYFQCIRIKNNLPSYLPQPRTKSQLKNNHPVYTEIHTCEKENQKYKPPRTSHCHIDGCIARFDHHCPYIKNCVGHRNLKVFLQFVGYGGTFALQFFILSIYKYYVMMSTGINPLTQGEVSAWMFLTAASFILVLSMLGLFLSNLYSIAKNITRIDLMKGSFKFNDKEGVHPNPFHLGAITNFANVFEGELWTFWWPTAMVPKYDGVKYPMIPPITDQDKKGLFENVQNYLKDPVQRSVPKTIEQLYNNQKDHYKNTIFFYHGEQYRIEDLQQKENIIVRKQQIVENKQPIYEEVSLDEHHQSQLKPNKTEQILNQSETI